MKTKYGAMARGYVYRIGRLRLKFLMYDFSRFAIDMDRYGFGVDFWRWQVIGRLR
jgi:hypothetical protein